jgi:PhnB protein
LTETRASLLKIVGSYHDSPRESILLSPPSAEPTMPNSYKPEGYTSVTPYLIVDGADGTIEFARRVFDAVELRRFAAPGGGIMHAEVRIDDTIVMVADGGPGWPPVPAHVHVYVPDVDEAYRRALAAGATSVQAPVKKDDDDK